MGSCLYMKAFLTSAFFFSLLLPLPCKAQNSGRIECARSDGYVYLYSSTTTMDVRATLQCGEIVQITSRFDNYFGVRTAKGDTGYVPSSVVVLLKDEPGTPIPKPAPEPPTRERTPYDSAPRKASLPAKPATSSFVLVNNTLIRVKLMETISSSTAHVDGAVHFESLEDILIDGVPVLPRGSHLTGVITLVEPKKRFGHLGKLAFNITSVRLADGNLVPVRCYEQFLGSSYNSSETSLPVYPGRDAVVPKDSEFSVFVARDLPLERESFSTIKNPPTNASDSPLPTPQP